MRGLKLWRWALLSVFLCACDTKEAGQDDDKIAKTETASHDQHITFTDTLAGNPLIIPFALFKTDAAKVFLKTGKNTYIGNEKAIAAGKKIFQLYSCTQCHGPEAKGQVGPGLIGPAFRYPKNATNKGMFETIWGGTNGGMGAKGQGLMDPNDQTVGITPDEMLKVVAWIRSQGSMSGNE